MKTLDRYIGRTVAVHTLVVLAVLLAMYFFSSFVAEMGYVGKGRYSFLDAVRYSLMLIPRQVYELFPLVALLGTMLGLGSLASSSELTVMRAAGVSVRRVVLAVLKVGLVMILVVGALGEGIAPPLEKIARLDRAKALAENISVNTEDGLWARDGNTYVNIRRLLPDGVASGISLYRFDDDHRLLEAAYAPKAQYVQGGWRLYNVRKSIFKDDEVLTQTLKETEWSTSLTPEVVNVVAVPPENLSAWDLYGFVEYLRENGLDARRYELSLWMRVVAPFAAAGMVLLAVPFVFGSLRGKGVGQRIVVGTLLGIGFYLFNGIFNRVALVYNLPPLLSALLPTLTVYALWLFMMRRVY